MSKVTKVLIFFSFFSILIALSMAEIPKPALKKAPLHRKVSINFLGYLDKKIKDTLYTTKKSYIEIDLKTQHAQVIMRSGEKFRFPVSTGTNTLYDGVVTNQGVFAIFSKAEVAVSSIFHCNLYYWMQFNHGIGLHGLDGTGYYVFLGKQPSSHGCVRTANEDIKIAFSLVEFGSPVLVHSGENNAVTISFVDENDPYIYKPTAAEAPALFKKRLAQLYQGDLEELFSQKIVIDNTNLGSGGTSIGDISKLPDAKMLLYRSKIDSEHLAGDLTIRVPGINDIPGTEKAKDTVTENVGDKSTKAADEKK